MPKRIVVCSDGTWLTPEHAHKGVFTPSNVYKMACAIAPRTSTGTEQIVFYDKGVGTNGGLDRLTGGAFGQGLFQNIEEAYAFLVHNYAEGDEIYFFGFSRGAFTVRSTAGLLRKCGLLQKLHADKFQDAYRLYHKRDAAPDTPEATEFRKNFAREVGIKFIGVWDTVGALGVPFSFLRSLTKHRYEFHDVKLSHIVEHAYHAVAIDERRKPFRPTLWEITKNDQQHVEQVWFAGVHSDVGGGFQDSRLADLTFKWMKEKAEACGLELDPAYVERAIKPAYAGKLHRSKTTFLLKMIGADYLRPIEQNANTAEAIHDSAFERYDDVALSYRPANLTEYVVTRGLRPKR